MLKIVAYTLKQIYVNCASGAPVKLIVPFISRGSTFLRLLMLPIPLVVSCEVDHQQQQSQQLKLSIWLPLFNTKSDPYPSCQYPMRGAQSSLPCTEASVGITWLIYTRLPADCSLYI